MALLRAEKIAAKYAAVADIGTDMVGGAVVHTGGTLVAGRFAGENALSLINVNDYFTIPLTDVSGTTIIASGSFYMDPAAFAGSGVGESRDRILQINNSGGDTHCGVSTNRVGQLITMGPGTAPGNVIARSAPGVLKYKKWHRLEIKAVIADAGGSLEVRLDGVVIFNHTGIDTLNGSFGTASLVRFYGADNALRWFDVIVSDGSGTTFNDFLGDYRMEVQLPDADGATAAWTVTGAASNWQAIDDPLAAYDDDTTYIESSTATQVNLASHANFALTNMQSILGVQVEALALAAVSGSLQLRAAGGVSVDSPTKTLTTIYKWQMHMFPTDPDTSAAWASAADINGTEFGVELIS